MTAKLYHTVASDSSLLKLEKSDYHGAYNDLISNVAAEFGENFAAIASPTLSKQETVTSLFDSIQEEILTGKKLGFPWWSLFKFPPRLLLKFVQLSITSIMFRVRQLPENSIYFRTWLVPRSLSSNEVKDDYFRELPHDLMATENVIVSYTPLKYSFLKKFIKNNKGRANIISHGLLTFSDLVKLFIDYVFTANIQLKNRHCNLTSIEIRKRINRSLLLDYLELRSFGAYEEKYKCRQLIKYKIKAFVYVYENQSWEKACCAALSGTGIRLIGYQSSGFSPVFLNFFPTGLDSNRQAMPDLLLTVGDAFTGYLSDHGHYRIPIKTFAALRFDYPNNGTQYITLQPNEIIFKRVIYAFSVHLKQYKNIILDLISAFEHTDISVDLKLHPLYHVDDIDILRSLPRNFRVIDWVDVDNLRDSYDFVLFNDNSFGIESLLKGVKSYQYSRSGDIDDRFMNFKLWKTSCTYEELLLLRDDLQGNRYDKSYDITLVNQYINSMYRPYSTDRLAEFSNYLNSSSP
jgi:hypothetical protein